MERVDHVGDAELPLALLPGVGAQRDRDRPLDLRVVGERRVVQRRRRVQMVTPKTPFSPNAATMVISTNVIAMPISLPKARSTPKQSIGRTG